jgi:hypothetical protein
LNAPDDAAVAGILDAVLRKSASADWRGHDKHDGLNSPLVWSTCGWSRMTRLLALQAVMRSPVNVRDVLGVPRVSNPKGLALFVQALVARWRMEAKPGDLATAELLAARLESLRSPSGRWSGRGWGYQYPWQDLGFFSPRGTPNAVVTCFVCEALLDLYDATGEGRYLEWVLAALPFLRHDLPRLVDDAAEMCLGYQPVPMVMRVMDVSILIGALYARCGALQPTLGLAHDAQRLVAFVVARQTADGAWWYTDPPHASPVRIDNYHTGFILDALWRYMSEARDHSAMPAYRKGLAFYAQHLFEPDGAPRWMSDRRYPHDVHGSAQGIVTFSRHGAEYPGLADRIAAWAIRNLYDGDGAFWYRRARLRVDRTFYLRWNNGWMARALADLLLYSRDLQPRAARRSTHATPQTSATPTPERPRA